MTLAQLDLLFRDAANDLAHSAMTQEAEKRRVDPSREGPCKQNGLEPLDADPLKGLALVTKEG